MRQPVVREVQGLQARGFLQLGHLCELVVGEVQMHESCCRRQAAGGERAEPQVLRDDGVGVLRQRQAEAAVGRRVRNLWAEMEGW